MKFSRAGNRHFSGIGVQPRGINANYWRKIQLTPKNTRHGACGMRQISPKQRGSAANIDG
jgi:hypothetical protein